MFWKKHLLWERLIFCCCFQWLTQNIMVNVKEAIHILSLKGVCDKPIHLVGLILWGWVTLAPVPCSVIHTSELGSVLKKNDIKERRRFKGLSVPDDFDRHSPQEVEKPDCFMVICCACTVQHLGWNGYGHRYGLGKWTIIGWLYSESTLLFSEGRMIKGWYLFNFGCFTLMVQDVCLKKKMYMRKESLLLQLDEWVCTCVMFVWKVIIVVWNRSLFAGLHFCESSLLLFRVWWYFINIVYVHCVHNRILDATLLCLYIVMKGHQCWVTLQL